MINIMLTSSSLPNHLLGEALYSICHILYKVPNKSWKKKTLHEIWKNWTSNIKILEVWGCLVKINIPIKKRRKLGPNAIGYIFIGYSLNSVTYRFLVINSEILEISNNPTLESCDAIFFEHIFPLKNKLSKLVRDSDSNSFVEITSNLNLQSQENSY